jgi:probable HAF family extracellular repeat protein
VDCNEYRFFLGIVAARPTVSTKNGHVVGYSSGPNGSKAFLWTRKTGLLDLGVLSRGDFSRACDVNNSGEVAGTSAGSSGKRAVLWTNAEKMRDLGVLPGDSESEAAAITAD